MDVRGGVHGNLHGAVSNDFSCVSCPAAEVYARPIPGTTAARRLEPGEVQVVGLAGAPWGRRDPDRMGFQAAVVDSQFDGRTGA